MKVVLIIVRVALVEVRVDMVLLLDALVVARLAIASKAPASSSIAWSKSILLVFWFAFILLAW